MISWKQRKMPCPFWRNAHLNDDAVNELSKGLGLSLGSPNPSTRYSNNLTHKIPSHLQGLQSIASGIKDDVLWRHASQKVVHRTKEITAGKPPGIKPEVFGNFGMKTPRRMRMRKRKQNVFFFHFQWLRPRG